MDNTDMNQTNFNQDTHGIMNQPENTMNATSGIHPSTVEDVDHNMTSNNTMSNNMDDSMTHPLSGSRQNNNTSLWIKKPGETNKDTISAVSSTPSEYDGSSDGSHRSPHAGSSSNRPVADKNAFIQSNETSRHWQNTMTPAQRAKQLAEEMDHNLDERRRSSGADKSLTIGGTKEIKLD